MNKEQQDKLWNELSEESKEIVINNYRNTYSSNVYAIEQLFGSHNLNPKPLTYEDINAKLYEHKSNIIQFMNTTSIKHEKKINAINKLLEVAKYLNKDWKPDWKDDNQVKWFIELIGDGIDIDYAIDYNSRIVYFPTSELAEQAIQILGEEIIRLALTTDY